MYTLNRCYFCIRDNTFYSFTGVFYCTLITLPNSVNKIKKQTTRRGLWWDFESHPSDWHLDFVHRTRESTDYTVLIKHIDVRVKREVHVWYLLKTNINLKTDLVTRIGELLIV